MESPAPAAHEAGDPAPAAPRNLEAVRNDLVNATLVVIALIGLAALPISLLRARDTGWTDAMSLQLAMYPVILVVTFLRRRLSYHVRSLSILFLAFAVGLAGLLSWGIVSGAEMYFFATVMLAAIFLGQRAGLVFVAACLAVFFLAGFLVHLGKVPLDFDHEVYARSAASWFAEATGFGFLAVATIASLGRLLVFLGESNKTLVDQADNLARANARLLEEIWEREKAQEDLKASEEQYRLVVENATDAIGIVADGRVRFLNPFGLEMLGYSLEEIREMPFLDLLHESDRELARERNQRREGGGLDNQMFEYRFRKRNGAVLVVQLNGVGITWKGRPAVLVMARDVTRMRAMENHLQRAQRMEAVGTLAGGLAHDFNNLLMGVQGHASLMGMNLAENNPLRENVRNIEEFVAEASRLTGQLLGFARGGKYEVRPTDMNALLEKSSYMFSRTRKEVAVVKNLAATWPGEVDKGQMEQVLLNLYVNAWQAMPGGGTLRLSTGDVLLAEGEAREAGLAPGRYVGISVTDTGQGMDEAILDRIFDPFFTTKERGRGTGLGLASAHGIVKNHGGAINVKSRPGQGATFRILVPASDRKVEEPERPRSVIARCEARVLFVDDEAVASETGRAMLEALGCGVTCAQSGPEALEILAKTEDGFELVILDMIMPGMNGRETLPRIRKLAPGVKVLLSSGYTLEGQVDALGPPGFDGFLKKPYTLEKLSEKIRNLLGKAEGGAELG